MSALHDAANKARVDEGRKLIAGGASVRALEDGYAPIHLALMARKAAQNREIRARIRIATMLADAGAFLNGHDGEGRTPLWHAVALGPIGKHKGRAIVKKLMKMGPRARAKDHEGYSIVHMAAVYGYEDVAAAALRAATPVDSRDEDGGTPLLHAAFHGWPRIITLLLRAGANPNSKSKKGQTPLHAAARSGELGIVRDLVRAGAKIGAKNEDGHTPLELAAWMRHGPVVEFLLSKGGVPGKSLELLETLRFSEGRRDGTTSRAVLRKMLGVVANPPSSRARSPRSSSRRRAPS